MANGQVWPGRHLSAARVLPGIRLIKKNISDAQTGRQEGTSLVAAARLPAAREEPARGTRKHHRRPWQEKGSFFVGWQIIII